MSSPGLQDYCWLAEKPAATWLLRQRKIGRLEVKKRGTQVDPLQLQRQLPGQEAGQATLLLAGTSAGVTAVLAQRKSPEATERP